MENSIKCPDCEKEYPQPKPGSYRCAQCLCKFAVNEDRSITIIPYFDEIKLEPMLVMLGVLGAVLVFAAGDEIMAFSERLNLFIIITLGIVILYKGVDILCRRYRGEDRFFRRFSRPPFVSDPDIRLRYLVVISDSLSDSVICMIVMGKEAPLVKLRQEIDQQHGSSLMMKLYENRYSPGWHWLSIHDVGATKGRALRTMVEKWGLEDMEKVSSPPMEINASGRATELISAKVLDAKTGKYPMLLE